MSIILRTSALAFLSVTVLLSGSPMLGASYVPSRVTPPTVTREIRAAWIATVANIDWPSTNTLSTAQQKAELIHLLDRAVDLKLNTVIFQVRPACDAMYPSRLEPWSEYLTGSMGKAPTPFYDPLAFVIEEAHQRGLELHAWFNPYRARLASAKSPISANHVSKTHPEFVRHYGKSLWLDPGEKAAQAYSLQVVMDVVKRYDVDGVHFDDYFYPYKEQAAGGGDLDFPDDASWKRAGAGASSGRDDWRRENVNAFIHRVYESIKATKPWVKFGISPFGIWRPGNPPQIQGMDAFARLYADSRLWLARGWVDYLSPQLYWGINQSGQNFPVLLEWWAAQNQLHRHLAPGMDCTKVGNQWAASEILNQISLTRRTGGVNGQVLWNMKALVRNAGLDEALAKRAYPAPALSPACPWLQDRCPGKPSLLVTSVPKRVSWKAPPNENIRRWVLQTRTAGVWATRILPTQERVLSLARSQPEIVAVSGVDPYGNMSQPAVVELAELTRQY